MEEAVNKVVASAVQIVVGLSDNRQMTFHTGFEGDEADEVVNARFDRIMRLADRQQARYEIPGLVAERTKNLDEIAQYQQDHAEAENNFQALKASMEGDLLKLAEMRQEVHEQGYDEFRKGGRQGSYRPVGTVKATLERIDSDVERVKKQIETKDAERTVALQNLQISIDRRTARIALLTEMIERAEAKAA